MSFAIVVQVEDHLYALAVCIEYIDAYCAYVYTHITAAIHTHIQMHNKSYTMQDL